jgi:hypothetical protein
VNTRRTEFIHPALRAATTALERATQALQPSDTGPLPERSPPRTLGDFATYQEFISELAEQRPEGYSRTDQLPVFSDSHRALILAAEPDCVDKLTLPADELGEMYAHRAEGRCAPMTLTGQFLDRRVEPFLRRQVLIDVQRELRLRAEHVAAWDDVERDAWYRSCP